MGSSGGHRKLPGGSDDFSWHTNRQTLRQNICIITITIFIISATHFVILNIIVIIVTLVKRKQSLVDATDDLVLADSREEKEIAFSADFSVTTSNQSNCFGQTCHFKTRTMRNSVHSRHWEIETVLLGFWGSLRVVKLWQIISKANTARSPFMFSKCWVTKFSWPQSWAQK